MDVYLPRDLELAKAAGEVTYPSVRAARDLLISSQAQAIEPVNAGHAPPEHLRQVMSLALRALGVSERRARKLVQMDLPELVLPAWANT